MNSKIKKVAIWTVLGVSVIANILLWIISVGVTKQLNSIEYDIYLNEQGAEEERQYLIDIYSELRAITTESMGVIQAELGESNSFKLSENSKNIILTEFKKLNDIGLARFNVKELEYLDTDNINIYNGIMNICHSVEKFNIYLAYGIDNESESGIKNATHEITIIINTIKELDKYNK